MKKNILLLLAVVLIFSCAAIALADVTLPPTLTLQVSVAAPSGTIPNVTYTATLRNYPNAASVPVITFFCNNVVVGTAPVNNLGVATLKLAQKSGQYHAISAWLNTPNPIYSNSVTYIVP